MVATLQQGQCAVCRVACKLYMDHDHSTGLLRGGLCGSCNVREGRSGDTAAMLAYRANPPAACLAYLWELPCRWDSALLDPAVLAYVRRRKWAEPA